MRGALNTNMMSDAGQDEELPHASPSSKGSGVVWPETDVARAKDLYAVAIEDFLSRELTKVGSHEEAVDVAQSFLLWLLSSERSRLAGYRVERGRLRHYVGEMLRHFMMDRHRKARAWKRGGRAVQVELSDEVGAVEGPAIRQWDVAVALSILNRVVMALEEEWQEKGKLAELRILLPALVNAGDKIPSKVLGEQLGSKDNGARSDLSRLGVRFRELLEAEVQRTLWCCPEDLADEMNFVVRAWAYEGE